MGHLRIPNDFSQKTIIHSYFVNEFARKMRGWIHGNSPKTESRLGNCIQISN